MNVASKPAIAIVPGAWHHPWHYRLLDSNLKQAGHEVTVCDLPSTGGEHPTKDIGPDVETIKRAITSYLDRGHNVALVMHSMGGFTGSAAVQGLSVQDHDGQTGVSKLIFMCAFVADEGFSFMPPTGGERLPYVRALGDSGWLDIDDPGERFYNDLPPDVQEENVSRS